MTGMIGADPQDLNDLAGTMDEGAKTLDAAKMRLKSSFQNARWHGDDAQRAKSNFAGKQSPQLSRVADMLRETAKQLRKDAQEQESASAVDGGGNGGLGRGFISLPLPVKILPDVNNGEGGEGPVFTKLPDVKEVGEGPVFTKLPDVKEGGEGGDQVSFTA